MIFKGFFAKKAAVVVDGIQDINETALSVFKKIGITIRSNSGRLKQYGYELMGELLVQAGSTTVDDKLIAKGISAGVLAAAVSFTGGTGAIPAALTAEKISPIIEGMLGRLNEPEVTLGKKLIAKGQAENGN